MNKFIKHMTTPSGTPLGALGWYCYGLMLPELPWWANWFVLYPIVTIAVFAWLTRETDKTSKT